MSLQLALLTCAAALMAAPGGGEPCAGPLHEQQPLKTGLYKPASLAVDRETDTLYFSHIHRPGELYYQTAKLDLNSGEYTELDVDNGFSLAVDPKRHDVYIGGHKGVYRMSAGGKQHLVVPGVSVWDVFYNDALYYVQFPSQKLHKYADGRSAPFADLVGVKVFSFAVDDDGYIVYSNATGLYGKRPGEGRAELYAALDGADSVRDIVLDRSGRAHAVAADGVHRVVKALGTLEKVADVRGAHGAAFDARDRLVVSTEEALVRLAPRRGCARGARGPSPPASGRRGGVRVSLSTTLQQLAA